MKRTPQLPPGFNPDEVPATVVYSQNDRKALVLHPLGDEHPNAKLTRDRLASRGWTIVRRIMSAAAVLLLMSCETIMGEDRAACPYVTVDSAWTPIGDSADSAKVYLQRPSC